MSMQNIQEQDLVHDEYGNYYEVLAVQKDGDTVKALEVANLYFRKSFELNSNGDGQPFGAIILDAVNSRINEVQAKERPIYALRDLLVNRIAIYAMDITKPPA